MKAGREFDQIIAQEVMETRAGEPVPPYSTQIEAAFEVARKFGVTLIPVVNHEWFAFVGPNSGWKDPGEFLQCLSNADFARSGAAVSDNAAYSICVAAYNAVKQRALQIQPDVAQESHKGLTH